MAQPGTRERTRQRKQAKDPGHSVARGPSLISRLEQSLLEHCRRYLEMKKIPFGEEPSVRVDTERGVIRGLAMAVATIRVPYENQGRAIKAIEKEFITKARKIP